MERKMRLEKRFLAFLLAITVVFGMAAMESLAGPKYVLKAGHSQKETHPWHVGLEFIAKRVAEKTNGEVKIEIYPNGVLGREDEMAESVQMGTLDMSGAACCMLASIVPRSEILWAAYVFRSYSHFQNVAKGPARRFFEKEYESKGVKLVAWFSNAKRCVYNRKHPIYKPEDLKDIKIRVTPGQIQVDTWRALGAMPTPVPFAELYTALQTGVVDAAEPDPNTEWEQKHYEVAPYLSLTEHIIPVNTIIMNLKLFNSMPKHIQKAIDEAGRESDPYEWEYDIGLHDAAIQKMLEKGVMVNFVYKKPFIEKTEPVRRAFVKKYGLEDAYKMILETKE